MSVEIFTSDKMIPGEDQELVDYGLDEQRWLDLPAEAKVAFGIAWLKASDETFEDPSDLTAALAESTGLESNQIRETNRSLLQKGYLNRSGFLTGGALKLSLNEEGYSFLEDEIEKVQ